MGKWQISKLSNKQWDEGLDENSSSYLHYSEWSKHMENLGWEKERFIHSSEKAYLQGFKKSFLGRFNILWFPDWIAGDYEFTKDFIDFIDLEYKFKFVFLKIRSHHLFSYSENNLLLNSFIYSSRQIDSAQTMCLDLTLDKNLLEQNLSKNWKRNLKRSMRLDCKTVEVNDPKIIVDLYSQLQKFKKLDSLFTPNEIYSLFNTYRDNIEIIGSMTPDGNIHAIRGAIIRKDKAIDIFAATDLYARKHYLSYRLAWDLVNICKKRNCQFFDFNGIEPEINPGVYNFKKGTGAKELKTLGEYEYSNSLLFRYAISFFLKWFK